jgi:hypothetical protein
MIHSASGFTGGMVLFQDGANPIRFWTNSLERFRVTGAGDVGIGTTTPVMPLQVKKDQTADTAIVVTNSGTTGATTTMSFVLQEAGTPQGWFRRYRDGTGLNEIGFSTNLAFTGDITGTKTERMRISSAGNVGIGTTTPTGKFEVSSTVAGGALIGGRFSNITANAAGVKTRIELPVFNGASGGVIEEIGNSIDGYRLNIFQDQLTGVVSFGTGGNNERMRISATGNVGIGTTSPNANAILDVQSTVKGSRPFPSMTEAQRLAIPATIPVGLHVYQTDGAQEGVWVYKSSGWQFAY